MKKGKLKGDTRVAWSNKLKELKKEGGWHFFIGKSILIRKIPYNFEVVSQESCISYYYHTLVTAVGKAISIAVEEKIRDAHDAPAILVRLKKIDKLVEETIKDIKASVPKKFDNPRSFKSMEGKYFCSKCARNHDASKAKGKSHIKFAVKEEVGE